MLQRSIYFTFAAAFGLLCWTRPLCAQSTTYVTGTAFADIKRFSSTTGVGYTIPGTDNSLDATAAGGGVRIGTFIHPKWTLELGIEDAGATKKTIANPYTILAAAS